MDTPSAYVQRCKEALQEYLRLRFLGVTHEGAQYQSGFMAAVTGRSEREGRDVRQRQTGERE